jgi:hypothetical protein
MRCYFMRDGHIAGVEEMPGLSDEEAIEKGRQMFEARKARFAYDGFEVWKLAQVLTQYPAPTEAQEPAAEGIYLSSRRTR